MGVSKWWDLRHSDQRQLCSDIRRFERENLTAFAAEPFNIRADVAEIRRLRWKTEYLKWQRRCMLQQVRGLEAEQPKLAFYPTKARPHPIAGFAIEGHREE